MEEQAGRAKAEEEAASAAPAMRVMEEEQAQDMAWHEAERKAAGAEEQRRAAWLAELPTAAPARVAEILTAAKADVVVQEQGWEHVWWRSDGGPGKTNAFGDDFVAACGIEALVVA